MATDKLMLLLLTLVWPISAQRLYDNTKCKQLSCPPCKFGHLKKNGCLTCDCMPNPCESSHCSSGEKCIPVSRTFPGDSYARCIDPLLPEQCQDPKDPGPCMAFFPVWYYDAREKMCRRFVFGGCRGNRNRFSTADECRKTCEPEYQYRNRTKLLECKSVKQCFNFCPYGHHVDGNGCTQCSCKPTPCSAIRCTTSQYCKLEGCYGRHHCPNGRAVCRSKCPPCPSCPFGLVINNTQSDGCPSTTCQCKPDPCQRKAEGVCPEFQVCKAVIDLDCVDGRDCSFIPTCTRLKGVVQIHVEVDVEHPPLVIGQREKQEIKELVKERFSKLMSVDKTTIRDIQINVRNKEMFRLRFTVVASPSTRDELVNKYYKLKNEMYNHSPSLTYNTHALIPNPDTLIAKPEKAVDSPNYKQMYMMAAIIAGCTGVVVLLAAIALVVMVKRRSHAMYRGSSNIPYRGMIFKSKNKEDNMAIL